MSWLSFLLPKPKYNFHRVDWLDVEGKLLTIDSLARSTQQSDKQQIIIQLDKLVDAILKEAGVPGVSFGERLKFLKLKVERESYQKLWQAHLKRNELVHDTGSFVADWEIEKHMQGYKRGISALRGIR